MSCPRPVAFPTHLPEARSLSSFRPPFRHHLMRKVVPELPNQRDHLLRSPTRGTSCALNPLGCCLSLFPVTHDQERCLADPGCSVCKCGRRDAILWTSELDLKYPLGSFVHGGHPAVSTTRLQGTSVEVVAYVPAPGTPWLGSYSVLFTPYSLHRKNGHRWPQGSGQPDQSV